MVYLQLKKLSIVKVDKSKNILIVDFFNTCTNLNQLINGGHNGNHKKNPSINTTQNPNLLAHQLRTPITLTQFQPFIHHRYYVEIKIMKYKSTNSALTVQRTILHSTDYPFCVRLQPYAAWSFLTMDQYGSCTQGGADYLCGAGDNVIMDYTGTRRYPHGRRLRV